MKITTKVTFNWDGKVVDWRGFEYFGDIEEAKKGSDAAKNAAAGAGQVGTTAQNLSASNAATQTSARNEADPFAKSLMPSANGDLSPYAQAQYGQAKTQNAMGAMDMRAQANKANALRGFNNSPGTSSSSLNTIQNRQGAADTEAYQRAQQNTLGQGLEGLKYQQGQQEIYNPNAPLQTATSAYGTQANAANVVNQSPTLLGDIGMGLGGLAQGAGSIMTGMGSMGAKF